MKNTHLRVVWDIDEECPGHFLEIFEEPARVKFVASAECFDFVGQDTIDNILKNYNYRDKNVVSKYYPMLLPKREVSAEVNAFVESLGGSPFAAVHIRRTDHIELARRTKNYISDIEFVNFIKGCDPQKVFVATDNEQTQKKMQKYPNVIVYKKIEESNQLRQTSLRDSIVDALIAARAKKFKGTRYSSYSELIDRLRK